MITNIEEDVLWGNSNNMFEREVLVMYSPGILTKPFHVYFS